MQKYEYKCAFIWGWSKRTTRVLNRYGAEGWELVTANWVWFYFKRPKL